MTPDMLRQEISKLVEQYANVALASKPFVAGETIIPPSGKVIGARELHGHNGEADGDTHGPPFRACEREYKQADSR